MKGWLMGPGAAFLNPLPNTTNYLGAYDRAGTLIRGRASADADGEDGENKGRRKGREDDEDDDADDRDEDDEDRDVNAKADGEEGASEEEEGEGGKVAAETREDLQPFPLNPYFRSEAVLSEGFREEIYRRIKEQGQTVREVSVTMSVTMERVAAVYRMKEMEKRRIQEVSRAPF